MPAIAPVWGGLGGSMTRTKPKDVFLQNLKKLKGPTMYKFWMKIV